LGEEFAGVISAVTAFGFFVELRDIFIEGLVHVSSLDKDFFHYDPAGLSLKGERTGIAYRLGDEVKVIVARVNLDDRKIDLDLVKPPEPEKNKAAPVKNRRRRKT
jgi:ribonuclease R